MTKDAMQRLIQRKEAEMDKLSEQYSGVRPSWVSAELSILWSQIDGLKQQLEEIQ